MRFAAVVGCVAFDKAETKFAVNGEGFRIFFININKTAAVFFYGKRKQRASQSLAKAVGTDEEHFDFGVLQTDESGQFLVASDAEKVGLGQAVFLDQRAVKADFFRPQKMVGGTHRTFP